MPCTTKTFRRYLASRLREALTDTPVVLIHGADRPRNENRNAPATVVDLYHGQILQNALADCGILVAR